ncbi:MAG: Plasmid recombination enzyme [Lachnoclostridium sp.]|jgi:uncharacterized surface protein with fasciclin (FAS1) repeats
MKISKKNINYDKIFKGKKVPILTLDERWHEIFPEYDKPAHIEEIEKKLNKLIKKQGKLITDLNEMKKLKMKLMQDIVNNMDVSDTEIGRVKAKKLDRNQKLIKEINEKITYIEDELEKLPYQIKTVNEKLIVESAKVCYARLNRNNEKVSEISRWVEKARKELKEKILEKQDMEMKNTAIYSYMHDVLGPELLQELDEQLR